MSFISPTVKTLVDQILDDPEFKARCKKNFDLIFADKVVTKDDIPLIINLILTVYQNHMKIKIKKMDLKPVFMVLITQLLDEFKGDTKLDTQMILLLIEPQIDLLLMSVQISRCPSWLCGSKPRDEESVLNKMKVNKVDKEAIEAKENELRDAVLP
tara:strand:+ start:6874 stop:7341 length:468 start_codon:yes stop_codon:yes gene_type:complete